MRPLCARPLQRLHDETEEAASLRAIAGELKLDESTTPRRVRNAIDKGFVKNLEDRRGKPGRYVPGDPLPNDIEILPTPEVLHRCTVASESEGVKTNFFSGRPEDGDERKSPSNPPESDATVQPQNEWGVI